MTSHPAVFKVVVTGPFSAGKTTFIETIVEEEFVTVAASTTSREEAGVKHSTTIGMDFGVLTLEDGGIELRVYGTPGQERFSFMWEVLGSGSDAYVLLVNGTDPTSWEASRAHHEVMSGIGIPGVIGVNRGTAADVDAAAEYFADLAIPVLSCQATDPEEVRQLLVTVLLDVLDRIEAEAPAQAASVVPTGAEA
jgi:uncharacterized protein